MRLHDILRSKGRPLAARPVSFTAIGLDENGATTKTPAAAVLICVSEHERELVRMEADKELARRFKEQAPVEAVRRDEETYHLLVRALRDAEPNEAGAHDPLCQHVSELRLALVLPEARRLMDEYEAFMAEEFPPKIDEATWTKLVDEAKKNSLSDLLTAYGFESCARVLSFLAGRSSR